MKSKLTNLYLLLFSLEGIAALAFYLAIPAEASGNLPFHQSPSRLALAGLMLAVILAAVLLFVIKAIKKNFAQKTIESIDGKLANGEHFLFVVSVSCLTAFVFSVEVFFLTFISLPPFVRPITIWAALAFLQLWIFLRIRHPQRYQTIGSILKRKWLGHTAAQRKTFLVLAAIGLVYFCLFIPANSQGWNGPAKDFYSGVDDHIQYPIAVSTLTRGDDFNSTVYHFMINESDVYGHQYVSLEALILLPSRIILGEDFGENVQLNLFLLRQFISVLFTTLSMFVMVYIINRFRNLWESVGMFVFLLTIPGIILFNSRFLHPDALILFLIVLTIYFLQRDNYTYKRDFFFAAITCSLAAVIKLWGFFFVFPVAFYLLYGLITKRLSWKSTLLSGLGFISVMIAAALVTNPGLLVPAVSRQMVQGIMGQIANRTVGYDDPTNSGVYVKDFPTWMKYFEIYYLQEYYFFFCFAALALCSFLGKRKLTAHILLTWCVPLAVFLINFIAAKSFWWMMELLIPLYPAPFLLLQLVDEKGSQPAKGVLSKVPLRPLTWALVIAGCGSQFVINLFKIFTK
jgi:hypothetical protein